MSKVSVFKFKINNIVEKTELIDTIISEYLNKNGFNYNSNEKCYMIGNPSEADANKNMALNIASTLERHALDLNPTSVSHLSRVYTNIHQCLEYEILGNQLIIKAYTFNAFSSIKAYIHSSINTNMAGKEYYHNLQTELFNELEKNNITLVSVESEKVVDTSNKKLIKKTILFVLPVIIIFTIITIIAYLSS